MDTNTIIGLAAGCLTAAAAMPQVVKTIKEKEASQVSPFMFVILFAGNGLWAYYGVQKSDIPIIVTNCFSLLLDVTMLYLKFKYKKN